MIRVTVDQDANALTARATASAAASAPRDKREVTADVEVGLIG